MSSRLGSHSLCSFPSGGGRLVWGEKRRGRAGRHRVHVKHAGSRWENQAAGRDFPEAQSCFEKVPRPEGSSRVSNGKTRIMLLLAWLMAQCYLVLNSFKRVYATNESVHVKIDKSHA